LTKKSKVETKLFAHWILYDISWYSWF